MKFGLNLNGAKLLPEKKLLEAVDWIKGKDPDLYEDIMKSRSRHPETPFEEFFSGYIDSFECNDNLGPAAFIAYLIGEQEGIALAAEDDIIALEQDLPWDFTEKVRAMSREDFLKLLCGYVYRFFESPVTADMF